MIVPLILVGMVDGRRGIRQAWPAAVVGGFTFAIGQFVCSNYISVELTDIVASLLSAASIVALRARLAARASRCSARPTAAARARRSRAPRSADAATRAPSVQPQARAKTADTRRRDRRRLLALPDHHRRLRDRPDRADQGLARERRHQSSQWPGLHVVNAKGEAPTSLTFKFDYLHAAGTLLLVAGLLTMVALRVSPGRALRVYGPHAEPAEVGDADRVPPCSRSPT